MAREDLQRGMLLSQLQRKQEMKRRTLYGADETDTAPLTELVMTNLFTFAIDARADVFSLFQRLAQRPANQQGQFNASLEWLQSLADLVNRSPYELLIDDEKKRRRILEKLLLNLKDCTDWDRFTQNDTTCSFVLPGFDYVYRMSEQPAATLIFEREITQEGLVYTMVLGDGRLQGSPFPTQAVLWQAGEGILAEFFETVIQQQNEAAEKRKQREPLARRLLEHCETLNDLMQLLQAQPDAFHPDSLLQKTDTDVAQIRATLLQSDAKDSATEEAAFLCAAAHKALSRTWDSQDALFELLNEAIYLLDNAAQTLIR